MVFSTFNLIFFLCLILLSWCLKKRWHFVLFVPAGIIFFLFYSPFSLALVLPFYICISYFTLPRQVPGKNNFSYNTLKSQALFQFLWLSSWVAYGYFITHFDFLSVKQENFEILLLGFYNLARTWNVFSEYLAGRLKGCKPYEVLSFFFFPPILFSGPIEEFEEFRAYLHKRKTKIQWGKALRHLCESLVIAIIGDLIYRIAMPPDFNFSEAGLPSLLLYIFSIGWLIHCRLHSYIELTRCVATLMGYPFKKPNFQMVYKSRSIASFWSRWNMSVGRWAMRYVLFRNFSDARPDKFLKILVVYFTVIGACHGIDSQYTIWGLLMGCGIALNFIYLYAKYKIKVLLLWDARFGSIHLKRFLTILFMHFTCILLVEEYPQIIRALIQHLDSVFSFLH